MSTQVQWKRGTTAQNNTYTGAIGEIVVDTTLKQLRLHDGVTQGGTTIGSSAVTVTTATNIAGGTAGQVAYQTAAGVTSFYGPGTAGQLLVSSGTSAPVYTNTASIYVGTALYSNTATNLLGGTPGQLPYQSSTGTTSFISTGSQGNILVSQPGAPVYTSTTTFLVGYANNLAGGAPGNIHYQSAANTSAFASNIAYSASGVASYTQATGQTFIVSNGGLGVTGNSYFANNLGVNGSMYVTGDLYVDGTQFIVNTQAIATGDKALVLSTGSTTALLSSGSGLYVGASSSTAYSSFYYDGVNGWIAGGTNGGSLMLGGATTPANGAKLTVLGGANFTTIVTATTFVGGLTGTATQANNLNGGAAGSIAIQSAAGTTAFIPIGTSGYILSSNGSSATWTALGGLSAGLATTATNIANGTAGQLPYQSAAGATSFINTATTGNFLQSNYAGAPTWTTTASMYVNSAVNSQNLYAGTAGQLVYQSLPGATSFINTATTGNFLQSNYAGAPAWTTTASMYVNSAVNAQNLYAGTAGQLVYQSAVGTTGFVGPGSFGQFLMSAGASAPVYQGTLTQVNGNIIITSNTAATSTNSGGLQIVNGGLGVGGGLYATGLNIAGISTQTGFSNFVGSGSQEYTVRFKGSTTGDQWAIGTSGTAGFGIANDVLNAAGTAYSTFTVSASVINLKTGNTSPQTALSINQIGQVGVGANYAGTGGALFAVNGGGYFNGIVTATTYYGTFAGTIGGTTTINTATNIANGTAGQLHYQSAPGVTAFVNTATTGNFLQANYVGTPTWTTTASMYVSRATLADTATTATNAGTAYATIGILSTGTGLLGTTFNGSANVTWTLNTATLMTTAVNLAGGVAGAVPYQSATGTTLFSAAGTTGQILVSGGTASPFYSSNIALNNFTATTIVVTSTASSTSSYSANALYVAGGIGGNSGFNINGNGFLNGNLTVNGTITGTNAILTVNQVTATSGVFYGDATGNGALYAGVTNYTPFGQTMFQASGNRNDYMEINVQNINAGAKASTDLVASADNVSISSAYIDMGIASSTFDGSQLYSLGNTVGPNDGYLMVGQNATSGFGDLVFGTLTSGTQMRFVLSDGIATTVTNSAIAMLINKPNIVATSTSTGTLLVYGGVGINGNVLVQNATTATSTTTGALVVQGGMGVGGNIYFNGNLYQNGTLFTSGSTSTTSTFTINNTTTSISTTTGALVVQGGFGLGGNFYSAGVVVVQNNTQANSTTTGALQVAGGAGIAGNMYVGGNLYTNGAQVLPTSIQESIATSGQTSFVVAGGYTVGTLQLFANGVQLASSDFTASNGTTVVVNTPRVSGDIIKTISGITSSTINNITARTLAYAVVFG